MAIDWNKAEHAEGLVSIGDHKLFLSVKGPARRGKSPVVIIEAGWHDSSRMWTAVQTELSKTHRALTYDRSGVGRSEPSTQPRSAANIASELKALLTAAGVHPPYIVLGHSYGGILIREFVACNVQDIRGLMLVDANTERTHIDRPVPWDDIAAITGTLDDFTTTRLDEEHKLTVDVWLAIKQEGSGAEHQSAAAGEKAHLSASSEALGSRRQFDTCVLGDCPVTVLKANSAIDFQRIYDAGVAAGNGTEEQRTSVRAFLATLPVLEESLQREQLHLSRDSRWMNAFEYGHNLQATNPLLVARELRELCEKAERLG